MMKKIAFSIFIFIVGAASAFSQGLIPAGEAYLHQINQRDSILIADQIEYGFELDSLLGGTRLSLQDFSELSNDTLVLVRNWKLDTLKFKAPGRRKKGTDTLYTVRGTIIIAPFEEGIYELPPILVKRTRESENDTLVFDPLKIDVKTMPVDTAVFEIHDIKGQLRYPLTFKETLPYFIGLILLAALTVLVIYFIRKRRERLGRGPVYDEPAYIIALRNLDRFRGDKYWSPEKQKTMYSGITDTLRTYIEDRFDVNAEEMTTAEIFDALKSCQDLPKDVFDETRELFELSDFVKFAKHTATDKENAAAIPAAVRFVTSTYQTQQTDEPEKDGGEAVEK